MPLFRVIRQSLRAKILIFLSIVSFLLILLYLFFFKGTELLSVIITVIILYFIVIIGLYHKKIEHFFYEKIIGTKIHVQIRTGHHYYKKGEYLDAYKIFRALILNNNDIKDREDLLLRVKEKQQNTIRKLETYMEHESQVLLHNINKLEKQNNYLEIIESKKDLASELQEYPNTPIILNAMKMIKEAHDSSLVHIWNEWYKDTRTHIKTLIKEKQHEKAIYIGKKFINEIQVCPDIPMLSIFRDDIRELIAIQIKKQWQQKYDITINFVKEFITNQEFEKAIKYLKMFLETIKGDTDIESIENLRVKAYRRLKTIKEKVLEIEILDNYDSLVTKALDCYYSKGYKNYKDQYKDAQIFMKKANTLLKEEELKNKKVILRDTQILVKNVHFIFLCDDKIIENQILDLISDADRLFNEGKDNKARNMLGKAQDLHLELSTKYIDVYNNTYKKLIRQIRAKIQRVSPETPQIINKRV